MWFSLLWAWHVMHQCMLVSSSLAVGLGHSSSILCTGIIVKPIQEFFPDADYCDQQQSRGLALSGHTTQIGRLPFVVS